MPMLKDSHGRVQRYLRLSVTDRCNLRCAYCLPPGGVRLRPREEILTFDEIERTCRALARAGLSKIRLTGGEPLVRRGLPDLAARLAQIRGIETLAATTNGLLLEELAPALAAAGVRRVNVSLDTLDRVRFQTMTGVDGHERVLRGVDAALAAGLTPLKVNTVVLRGFNDDELANFVAFACRRRVEVRFIELMPLGGSAPHRERFVSAAEMKARIGRRFDLIPQPVPPASSSSAEVFAVAGQEGGVGFIAPVSRPFCRACNRIRLTADGSIKTCLARPAEENIRALLRGGAGEDEIAPFFQAVLDRKALTRPAGAWACGRCDLPMQQIGG